MYITVYSISKFKEAKNLKVGDVVELVKEPNNQYDSDAIKVFLGEVQVGYVAQSEHTKLKETKSATEIQEVFVNKVKARINEVVDSGNALAFKCELINEPVKKEKKEPEVSFKISGSFSSFPNKRRLLEDGKTGARQVQLIKSDNNIIVQYLGINAGQVSAKDDELQIILEHIQDSPIVTAMATTVGERTLEAVLDVKKSVTVTNLDEEIDRIIKEGINTQEEINEKLEYLKECRVPRSIIGLLFKSYIKYPDEVAKRIPKKPKTLYFDSGDVIESSLFYMLVNKHLRYEGNKGVGKNVAAKSITWLTGRPEYKFSTNSQHSNNSFLGGQTFAPMESETKKKEVSILARLFAKFLSKFTGKKDDSESEVNALESLINSLTAKHGQKLVFEMSAILEAFVNGGVLVLDEFNTALAHVMPIFNSLLDDNRMIEVTGLGLSIGHVNFCAISTENKDYQGTFDSNEATADRFEPIVFPQLESISKVLQARVPGIDFATMNLANDLYMGIKSSTDLGEDALTIRGFISACEVIMIGMDKKKAFTKSVANRASDLSDRKAIQTMIDLQIGD